MRGFTSISSGSSFGRAWVHVGRMNSNNIRQLSTHYNRYTGDKRVFRKRNGIYNDVFTLHQFVSYLYLAFFTVFYSNVKYFNFTITLSGNRRHLWMTTIPIKICTPVQSTMLRLSPKSHQKLHNLKCRLWMINQYTINIYEQIRLNTKRTHHRRKLWNPTRAITVNQCCFPVVGGRRDDLTYAHSTRLRNTSTHALDAYYRRRRPHRQ